MLSLEFADRNNRVGFSSPLYLDVGDVERWDSCDRKTDHFITIICRGKRPISLVGRFTGWNKKHAVEMEFFTHLACNGQVPIVNRVETAAEKSEAHESNVEC